MPVRQGGGLEIGLPEGELNAVRVQQAQFRREAWIIGGDDQIETGWHTEILFGLGLKEENKLTDRSCYDQAGV
jgi:hypothetical protein